MEKVNREEFEMDLIEAINPSLKQIHKQFLERIAVLESMTRVRPLTEADYGFLEQLMLCYLTHENKPIGLKITPEFSIKRDAMEHHVYKKGEGGGGEGLEPKCCESHGFTIDVLMPPLFILQTLDYLFSRRDTNKLHEIERGVTNKSHFYPFPEKENAAPLEFTSLADTEGGEGRLLNLDERIVEYIHWAKVYSEGRKYDVGSIELAGLVASLTKDYKAESFDFISKLVVGLPNLCVSTLLTQCPQLESYAPQVNGQKIGKEEIFRQIEILQHTLHKLVVDWNLVMNQPLEFYFTSRH